MSVKINVEILAAIFVEITDKITTLSVTFIQVKFFLIFQQKNRNCFFDDTINMDLIIGNTNEAHCDAKQRKLPLHHCS